MSWVYLQSEPSLWTVGYYHPDRGWQAESDWDSTVDAAQRVHYLNGGQDEAPTADPFPAFAALLAEALRRAGYLQMAVRLRAEFGLPTPGESEANDE